jgi:hypothetical protein
MLSACQTPEVSPTIVATPSTGNARGIDMATDSSDVVSELQGRPWLHFVARYYRDPASRYPTLSPDEARRLSALGVKIVTVWEWHSSTPSYFTYANGYNDALSAHRQAKIVGQPPGSAIYFAVDFNARGNAMLAVDQYFRGVATGLAAAGRGRPEYRVGVYGSGSVCAAVRGAGLAQYAWLSGSTAWEGTSGYTDWNIRQAAQGARFANLSFDHDANEARADYGGFQLGNYPRMGRPVEPVVAVAAAAPAAAAAVVSSAVNAVVPQPTTPAPPPPAPMVAAATSPPPAAPAVAAAPSPPPSAPVVAAAPPPAALSPPPMAAAAPSRPTLLPVAAVSPPRPASPAAAEVAALAAAEPKFAAAAPPRAVAEPEPPPSSRRAEARENEEKSSHERRSAGAAKGSASASAKSKVHPVAVSSRAVAATSRRVVRETHEPTRKAVATTRQSEERATHHATAKAAVATHTAEHATHHRKERQVTAQ